MFWLCPTVTSNASCKDGCGLFFERHLWVLSHGSQTVICGFEGDTETSQWSRRTHMKNLPPYTVYWLVALIGSLGQWSVQGVKGDRKISPASTPLPQPSPCSAGSGQCPRGDLPDFEYLWRSESHWLKSCHGTLKTSANTVFGLCSCSPAHLRSIEGCKWCPQGIPGEKLHFFTSPVSLALQLSREM